MKKFVSLLLAVIMLAAMLTVLAVPASAAKFAGDADKNNVGRWAKFSTKSSGSSNIKEFYYIFGLKDSTSYKVAAYTYNTASEKVESKEEKTFSQDDFISLLSDNEVPAVVREAAAQDYSISTGSTLSAGSVWIIVAVAVVALGAAAAVIIIKKKKQPAQE